MSLDWPVLPLEQCLDALIDYRGKTPEKTGFGVPLVTAKVIKGGRIERPTEFIATEAYESWMRRGIPRAGDVVLTTEAPLGEVAQLGHERVALAQRVVTLRGKAGLLDNAYLRYLLQTEEMQSQLAARATGTTVLGIKQSELRKVLVQLPPIDMQRSAASLLASLDDRIALLRETNATLEAIAQALFKSWFVDFDPVRAKSQGLAPAGMDEATAALFPEGFEESALGPLPAGWYRATLADVSIVGIGKTPPRKEPNWFSEDSRHVRWVSIRDMGESDAFLFEASEYLTTEAVQRFNVRVVPDRTVMLSFKLTVGRVAISDGEMTTNEAIAHFKLDPTSPLTSEYLYLTLKDFDFATLSSTSSIAEAVNSKTVRGLPVLVPSEYVVWAFQQLARPLFERMKLNAQQARSLAAARDALLPRLISGQLRLPNAEAIAEDAL